MIKFILLLIPFLTFGQTLSENVALLFQKKQYPNAESALVLYLNNNPKDIKALELLGETYAFQEKWDAAISIFEQLVDKEPSNANYHYKLGGVLGMKAINANKLSAFFMIDDVKKELSLAAKLDPKHIDVRWALIDFYVQTPNLVGGSMNSALEYANQLELISPVDGYLSKGYIYEYNDEPKLAEKYYKKAIDIGGSITCFQKLTGFYENQDKPLEAISTIEEASKKLNRNSLNYQLGKVCANYNLELDKGEMCLIKFIEDYSIKDGVPIKWAYLKLAQIYKHKHNKIKALEWVNKSLASQSDFQLAVDEKKLILNM